jgi:hypothetical protein
MNTNITINLIRSRNAKITLKTAASAATLFVSCLLAWSDQTQTTNAYLTGFAPVSVAYADSSSVSLDRIVDAIAIVESQNDTTAIGDNGRAVGAWQLHKCAVDHVNQRYKTTYSWPSDCLSKPVAREIVKKYLSIILSYQMSRQMSLEEVVRRYNGGYKHWQSEAAGKYYEKVMKVLR